MKKFKPFSEIESPTKTRTSQFFSPKPSPRVQPNLKAVKDISVILDHLGNKKEFSKRASSNYNLIGSKRRLETQMCEEGTSAEVKQGM